MDDLDLPTAKKLQPVQVWRRDDREKKITYTHAVIALLDEGHLTNVVWDNAAEIFFELCTTSSDTLYGKNATVIMAMMSVTHNLE